MEIVTATLDHLDDLTPLFDAYRVFYEQPSNLERARSFLRERMHLRESVVFMAYADSRPVGFTQLYPSFSSVSTQRLWILNDLYIVPELRGQRVGERLIERAARFSAEFGAKGLLLSTAITNTSGQRLYERVGFVREEAFYEYFLET